MIRNFSIELEEDSITTGRIEELVVIKQSLENLKDDADFKARKSTLDSTIETVEANIYRLRTTRLNELIQEGVQTFLSIDSSKKDIIDYLGK